MSNCDKLIAQHCPNGVECKPLYDIGHLYGGLTGKTKVDFNDGNAKYIPYMNVFSNIAVNTQEVNFVKIDKHEKQNEIQVGDVLFTSSSENAEECGMSSVFNEKINEKIYLNSFCFGFRLKDKKIFLSDFLKHLFRDIKIRKKIIRTANGVTRFNISKKSFAKIKIPIPPLEIQQEIVDILDSFTKLEAELEAELEARKKQYTYYLDELFNFDKNHIKYLPMGEVGTFIRGNGLQKKDFVESGVGCIHYGQIHTYYRTYTDKPKSFVSSELAKRLRKAKKGDLIIATTSENDEGVCKAVAWLGNDDIAISGDACIFQHSLHPKYVSYCFMTEQFQKQKTPYIIGTKVRRVSGNNMSKIKIPVPPLPEQERIVAILDRFDALVNDISIGLPAEIKTRRQQYEHYRNKLLTFNESS